MNELFVMGSSLLSAVFAAGGAYAAVRVHLHYHRRDIDALLRQVSGLDARMDQCQWRACGAVDQRGHK